MNVTRKLRIERYGTKITDHLDSLAEQGFKINELDHGFYVHEKEVSCVVRFNEATVRILSRGKSIDEDLLAFINILDEPDAAQKIVDTVRAFLDKNLELAYPKGGDTA